MTWNVAGRYMETCNCDFLCPCPTSGLKKSTHGNCVFAMAFDVDRGGFDGIKLDGLKFIVVGSTPGNMIEGNWKRRPHRRPARRREAERGAPVDRERSGGRADGQPRAAHRPVPRRRAAPHPLRAQRLAAGRSARARSSRSSSRWWGSAASRCTSTTSAIRRAIDWARPRQEEPRARVRHRLGRRQRPQQRPSRPVRVAGLRKRADSTFSS